MKQRINCKLALLAYEVQTTTYGSYLLYYSFNLQLTSGVIFGSTLCRPIHTD